MSRLVCLKENRASLPGESCILVAMKLVANDMSGDAGWCAGLHCIQMHRLYNLARCPCPAFFILVIISCPYSVLSMSCHGRFSSPIVRSVLLCLNIQSCVSILMVFSL